MAFGRLIRASALFTLAMAANNNNNNKGAGTATNNNAAAGNAASLTLDQNAVQSGSFVDGQASIGAESFEAPSLTSQNNFINFCSGKTLTNGLQILTGSCNGIVMGDIPAKKTMISSIILSPQNGQTIQSGKDFNITVQVQNLQAGAFTNADATYYAAPQQLNGAGQVIGHTHVTVQDLGKSLNPSTPPDPTQFAFFKGINDAGNGKGTLAAVVAGGLPPGNYRVCTLTSSANHQPVIMPVAQRGSQDDCTKFVVNGNNDTTNAAANNGAKGQAAAALAASAVAAGPGFTTATAAAAATSSAAAANNNNNNKGKGAGANGKGANAASASASAAAATTAAAANNNNKGNANANANANNNKGNAKGNAGAASASASASATKAANGKAAATTDAAKASASAAAGNKGANGKGQGQGQGQGQGAKAKRLIRLARREFVA